MFRAAQAARPIASALNVLSAAIQHCKTNGCYQQGHLGTREDINHLRAASTRGPERHLMFDFPTCPASASSCAPLTARALLWRGVKMYTVMWKHLAHANQASVFQHCWWCERLEAELTANTATESLRAQIKGVMREMWLPWVRLEVSPPAPS